MSGALDHAAFLRKSFDVARRALVRGWLYVVLLVMFARRLSLFRMSLRR